MNKLMDWKNRLKKGHMLSIICVLLIIVAILVAMLYKKQREYRQASENNYNMAFYELVDYVQNVETYLAKSLISSSTEHGAETLTHLWREANLAQAYLSRLPIESQELENTEKFLNQVSDYSYTLSRKNIYDDKLSEEDLKNLKDIFFKFNEERKKPVYFLGRLHEPERVLEKDEIELLSLGNVVSSPNSGLIEKPVSREEKSLNTYWSE